MDNNQSNLVVQMLKKRYEQTTVIKKDFTAKELFSNKKEVKEYQQEDGSVVLSLKAISTKFVPKYKKDENEGIHTTLYLTDGKITGCFSGSFLAFARFLFQSAGMDTNGDFSKIDFVDGCLRVKITKIDLIEGRTTYNIEILDGNIDKVEKLDSVGGISLLEGNVE